MLRPLDILYDIAIIRLSADLKSACGRLKNTAKAVHPPGKPWRFFLFGLIHPDGSPAI